MPGKLCNGSTNNGATKDSKAFCEGREARAAAVSPTNPHEAGSDAADAWDAGVAAKAAETTADDDLRCCAPCGAKAT
jgi:hypothetical protein